MALRSRRRARAAPLPPLVYRWDLDKTYLKSEFDSLRELVRIPFEKAEDKIAAPGVTALIRSLREAAGRQGREVYVQFISASPPQIGRAIRKKLELDGVIYDSIIFKDQLHRLMRGKFRHLREQVGYKLTELLKARSNAPTMAREYLFGDDWESDPLIYSLYADVSAGRVGAADLAEILQAVHVDPPLIAEACALAESMTPADVVARIFISLERRTPPANFRYFGARLVPTFNYFQTAVCLFHEGVLDPLGVREVAGSLLRDSAYSAERLANSLADVQRRGHVDPASAAMLREYLRAESLLPLEGRRGAGRWRARGRRIWARLRDWWRGRLAATPSLVDYRALVTGDHPGESS
jgi:hypothetical protein